MTQSHSLSITRQADVITSRRTAKQLAQDIGFNAQHQEEVSLAVSELASNLVKHALRGIITLKAIDGSGCSGIMISSQDHGPGFDVQIAMRDGYSSTGTLGYGLGAVNRLVDEMEVHSNQDYQRGTHIICKKWLAVAKSRPPLPCPLDIGVVTCPKLGLDVNGDSFVVKHGQRGSLISVIDGVGHGVLAYRSAQAARHYIESHSEQTLADIIRGVDRACAATSGVVMALAYFDWLDKTLTFTSIGNIEAKAFGSSEKVNLQVRRGIVGRRPPAPVVGKSDCSANMILALHSDGLSTRWHWGDFAHLVGESAQSIAEQMHGKLHKNHDDATLLLVKWLAE